MDFRTEIGKGLFSKMFADLDAGETVGKVAGEALS